MRKLQWEKIFEKQILKSRSWKCLSKGETDILFERKRKLNKSFQFTDGNLQRLMKLNDVLHNHEKELHNHADHLRRLNLNWVENETIIDFEIDFEISLFSSKYEYLNPEIEGNPFYEHSLIRLGNKFHNAEGIFKNDNWNEFSNIKGHPLWGQFHCFTFHELYHHTYLTWQDLVNIEDVWVEFINRTQFLFMIENHNRLQAPE